MDSAEIARIRTFWNREEMSYTEFKQRCPDFKDRWSGLIAFQYAKYKYLKCFYCFKNKIKIYFYTEKNIRVRQEYFAPSVMKACCLRGLFKQMCEHKTLISVVVCV